MRLTTHNFAMHAQAAAAAVLIGLAASSAAAQQSTAGGQPAAEAGRPAASPTAEERRRGRLESGQTVLPPAPERVTEEGPAGAAVGASRRYGYDDKKLRERARKAYGGN